jgi:hypothetical protein
MFGTASNPIKVYNQYKCTFCGNWLYQNTADGDPPNEWRMGGAPIDTPNP